MPRPVGRGTPEVALILSSFDRTVAVLGLFISVVGVSATILVPEFRSILGLDAKDPIPDSHSPGQASDMDGAQRTSSDSVRPDSSITTAQTVRVGTVRLERGEGFSFAMNRVVRGRSDISLYGATDFGALYTSANFSMYLGPVEFEQIGRVENPAVATGPFHMLLEPFKEFFGWRGWRTTIYRGIDTTIGHTTMIAFTANGTTAAVQMTNLVLDESFGHYPSQVDFRYKFWLATDGTAP